MSYVYSATTNSFYLSEYQADYEKNQTWPSDTVEVDNSVFEEFTGTPPEGKQRGPVNGHPSWVDIPQPDPEVQYEYELKAINDAYSTDKIILRDAYVNAMLFDGPTEVTKRTAIYNQLLTRNQQYAADIEALGQKYGG